MHDKIIDFIGESLWVLMFCTPLITLPVFWRKKSLTKTSRVVFALLLAACISFFLFLVVIGIAFRDGMGP